MQTVPHITKTKVFTPDGRTKDCYYGWLEDGDVYAIPDTSELYCGDSDILKFMQDRHIEPLYQFGIDDKNTPESIELHTPRSTGPLVTYPYGPNCLKEAVMFLMDQEVLHGEA